MSVEHLGETSSEFSFEQHTSDFALDAAQELLNRIVGNNCELGIPGSYDHTVTPVRVNGIQRLLPGVLSVSVFSTGDGKGFGDWHITGENFQIGQSASYEDGIPRVLNAVDVGGEPVWAWSSANDARGWQLACSAIHHVLDGSYTVARGDIDGVVN